MGRPRIHGRSHCLRLAPDCLRFVAFLLPMAVFRHPQAPFCMPQGGYNAPFALVNASFVPFREPFVPIRVPQGDYCLRLASGNERVVPRRYLHANTGIHVTPSSFEGTPPGCVPASWI